MNIKFSKILATLLVALFVVTLTASAVSASAAQPSKADGSTSTAQVTKADVSDLTAGLSKISGRSIPAVTVYWDSKLRGESWTAYSGYLYVGDHWNDEISSIVVHSGNWQFYQHSRYRGVSSKILGPGVYRWVEDPSVNMPNDSISSFKLISR